VREDERQRRSRRLDRAVAAIRAAHPEVPTEDRHLVALTNKEWVKYKTLLGDLEIAALSAYVSALTRTERLKYTRRLVDRAERSEAERRARRFVDATTIDALRHAEELVGALYDLVPLGSSAARFELLKILAPLTPFQTKYWDLLITIAAHLAVASPRIDWELLPDWAAPAGASEDEQLESLADTIREGRGAPSGEDGTVVLTVADLEELPRALFDEPELQRGFEIHGARFLDRITRSSRPAVAMALHLGWLLERKDRWRRFCEVLDRIDQLVQILDSANSFSDGDLAGGPLAARAGDVSRFVLDYSSIEMMESTLAEQYRNAISELEKDGSTELKSYQDLWDESFIGMSDLCHLVNDQLARHGATIERTFGRLPRRPRQGTAGVESDLAQLSLDEQASLFTFGCDVLTAPDCPQRLLRAWLLLWLALLRPKEVHRGPEDLVPLAGGYALVISRDDGKTGRREAYLPPSGITTLGLTPRHLASSSARDAGKQDRHAAQACRRVRRAWEQRRESEPELPDIPDRMAYFVRKVMSDVVRWNASEPRVITFVLGHDTEVSDLAYTLISVSEHRKFLADQRTALTGLL